MQNRKNLAEAGRRKLEEFRKAKQQAAKPKGAEESPDARVASEHHQHVPASADPTEPAPAAEVFNAGIQGGLRHDSAAEAFPHSTVLQGTSAQHGTSPDFPTPHAIISTAGSTSPPATAITFLPSSAIPFASNGVASNGRMEPAFDQEKMPSAPNDSLHQRFSNGNYSNGLKYSDNERGYESAAPNWNDAMGGPHHAAIPHGQGTWLAKPHLHGHNSSVADAPDTRPALAPVTPTPPSYDETHVSSSHEPLHQQHATTSFSSPSPAGPDSNLENVNLSKYNATPAAGGISAPPPAAPLWPVHPPHTQQHNSHHAIAAISYGADSHARTDHAWPEGEPADTYATSTHFSVDAAATPWQEAAPRGSSTTPQQDGPYAFTDLTSASPPRDTSSTHIPITHMSLADAFGGQSSSTPDWSSAFPHDSPRAQTTDTAWPGATANDTRQAVETTLPSSHLSREMLSPAALTDLTHEADAPPDSSALLVDSVSHGQVHAQQPVETAMPWAEPVVASASEPHTFTHHAPFANGSSEHHWQQESAPQQGLTAEPPSWLHASSRQPPWNAQPSPLPGLTVTAAPEPEQPRPQPQPVQESTPPKVGGGRFSWLFGHATVPATSRAEEQEQSTSDRAFDDAVDPHGDEQRREDALGASTPLRSEQVPGSETNHIPDIHHGSGQAMESQPSSLVRAGAAAVYVIEPPQSLHAPHDPDPSQHPNDAYDFSTMNLYNGTHASETHEGNEARDHGYAAVTSATRWPWQQDTRTALSSSTAAAAAGWPELPEEVGAVPMTSSSAMPGRDRPSDSLDLAALTHEVDRLKLQGEQSAPGRTAGTDADGALDWSVGHLSTVHAAAAPLSSSSWLHYSGGRPAAPGAPSAMSAETLSSAKNPGVASGSGAGLRLNGNGDTSHTRSWSSVTQEPSVAVPSSNGIPLHASSPASNGSSGGGSSPPGRSALPPLGPTVTGTKSIAVGDPMSTSGAQPLSSYGILANLADAAGNASPDVSGLGASAASEPSFLESYLDNLLRLDDKSKEGGRQPGRAGDSSSHRRTGSMEDISRRVSVNGSQVHGEDTAEASASTGPSAFGHLEVQQEHGDDAHPSGSVQLHELSAVSPGAPSSPGRAPVPRTQGGLPPRVPQHKRHDSVESAASHDAGFGLPRGPSQQFSLLQQHIDELTEEKLGLQRGMAQQLRLAESLAQENQALTEQYNTQAHLVEALQKKIQRYEDELEAQVLALEGLASEREAARALAQETAQRLSSVATEVVTLEQSLMGEKSARMRADEACSQTKAAAAKLERRVAAMQQEAAETAAELEASRTERRGLVVRVKQLEARLQRAEGKRPLQDPQAPVPPPAPPPPPKVDQQVQCDLLPPPAAPQTSLQGPSSSPLQGQGQDGALTVHTAVGPFQQVPGEECPFPGASSTAQSAHAGPSLHDVNAEEPGHSGEGHSSPGQDVTSAILADRALSSLSGPTRVTSAKNVDPLALLSRWLPQGPISGSSPVSAIAEEEMRAVHSVHELLGQYEQAVGELLQELQIAQADNLSVLQINQQLRQQLQSMQPLGAPPLWSHLVLGSPQLQGSEVPEGQLDVSFRTKEGRFSGGVGASEVPGTIGHVSDSRSGHLAVQPGHWVQGVNSSPHTHWSQHPAAAPAAVVTHSEISSSSGGGSGGLVDAAAGPQGRAGGLSPPSSSSDQIRPEQTGMGGLQVHSPTSPPPRSTLAQQQEGALRTPPASQLGYAVMPGSAGLPSGSRQQQQRGSWLGFLFRGGAGRPKKRVRETLM